jgi:hypothetical protein
MTNTDASPLTMVDIIYRQLEATITMLQNAIAACPDDLWVAKGDGPAIWQQAYHATFWLFAWARDWNTPFETPAFHSQEALELRPGATPVITREQLAAYARDAREACLPYLRTLTPEALLETREAFGKSWTTADRIFSQLRHVQHHVGAMHAQLGKRATQPLQWIAFNE